MARFTFKLSAVAILLLASIAFAAVKLDGVIPLVIAPPVSAAYAGDPVTMRVTLSGSAVGNEVMTVSSPTSSFSTLQSFILVPTGATYVDVSGTLNMNTGTAEVEATIGQTMVDTEFEVLEERD